MLLSAAVLFSRYFVKFGVMVLVCIGAVAKKNKKEGEEIFFSLGKQKTKALLHFLAMDCFCKGVGKMQMCFVCG